MGDTASFTFGGKTVELPVLRGTDGPAVVDIRKLYAELDVFTYDPSFTSTASCESKITFIDGDAGILLHRGYPIKELVEQSSFLEVCYLLLHGELPTVTNLRGGKADAGGVIHGLQHVIGKLAQILRDVTHGIGRLLEPWVGVEQDGPDHKGDLRCSGWLCKGFGGHRVPGVRQEKWTMEWRNWGIVCRDIMQNREDLPNTL